VADLSEALFDKVKVAHAAAAEKGIVDRDATLELLAALRIRLLDSIETEELLDVMDADGSGDIDFEEVQREQR
jgi:hypothetical protein